ncbi:pilus assembly protein PilM [Candidatus Kaiserbacteria bacterium]|nr:pilus assembly protein PilM [Candidatus Kaiserbacteria bacterium]
MSLLSLGSLRGVMRAIVQAFPVPKILIPPTAGIDISDASIKWLIFAQAPLGLRVQSFGEVLLPPGAVESGIIRNGEALAAVLAQVRRDMHGVSAAHAALPEEAAYVFSMSIPPKTPHDQVLRMIEFEFEGRVPIPPSAAVYDYTVMHAQEDEHTEISVVVFPRDVASAYVEAFNAAGITLLSLEIEARSIARAVSSNDATEPMTLLVDFGRARTGFAVIREGTPIFTSTVEVGGDFMTRSLTEKMAMSPEDVEKFKNDQGLVPLANRDSSLVEALLGTASTLADEVARHYHYWDTRRNEHGERMTPLGQIILVGGNANLRGLSDYIAGRVQATAVRGNVWRNVAPFDAYIPPITRNTSMQYATAIGLALRNFLGHRL